MGIEVVRFNREHLKAMNADPRARGIIDSASDDNLTRLEKNEYSYTAIEGDRVLCCAGLVMLGFEHRYEAWAIVAADARDRFIAIHHLVRTFLKGCPVRRIEATIECEYTAAHRWASSLGFVEEAKCMRGYRFDGQDCALYARIKSRSE